MRLVIYEKQNGGFYKEIENTKVVARLRNYLIDGVLNEEGIEVLLQTLFQFQESTRFHQLHHVLCVATATMRQSENKEEIKKLASEHGGKLPKLHPKILPHPDMPKKERRKRLSVHVEDSKIVKRADGTVEKVEKWGKKRLAYPVGRHREGSYVLLVVEAGDDPVGLGDPFPVGDARAILADLLGV